MKSKVSLWWGRIGCLGALLLVCAVLYPVIVSLRRYARLGSCAGNLKQIGVGLLAYSQDNDGLLPPVDRPLRHATWKTDIMPYVHNKAVFLCPEQSSSILGKDGLAISYAVNTAGVGRTSGDRGPFAPSRKPVNLNRLLSPEQVIAVCEVQNTTSPGFDIDDPFFGPRRQVLYAGHNGGSNYLFLDGHTRMRRPLETASGNAAGTVGGGPMHLTNMWYLDCSKPLSDNGMRILAKTEKVFGGAGH